MRVGITLPQFADAAEGALEAARTAETAGIDGVFCFDHLWPMGRPDRPALSSAPLLGALAASTSTLSIGTLVARVGLVPDEVLVAVLLSLADLSAGRLIAGLGTGDLLNRAENEAYGVPFGPADERRGRMAMVATTLRARGIPVWIGGGRAKTMAVADRVGAAVNVWGADAARVAALAADGREVTWGGPVGRKVPEVASRLGELARAGASWAVCAWPGSVEVVAEAAELVRASR
jgi:alkanesulfonate monooxygenase SsuD/methylene tetrahydromethanopterin reductase-like flavin-dependent oxidoreductase (luciferase family)